MDRRLFLAGAAATLTAPMAAQAAETSAFAGTPLAGNKLAQHFLPLPHGTSVPDVVLAGDNGSKHHLSELTGKNRLVAIWAEWCAPCLLEAGDLAKLYARYGGPNFEVLSLLTSSSRKLDIKGARSALTKTHAQALPLWVEPNGGSAVAKALANDENSGVSFPCTLWVDKTGAVRGRMMGVVTAGTTSLWATPDADAFVRQLAAGTPSTGHVA